MAFNRLLWKCVTSEKSHSENKVAVSVDHVDSGEVVLFFVTDTDDFRKAFSQAGKASSDLLVFFKKKHAAPLLLFVELKGSHADHAITQLEETIKAVCGGLHQHCKEYKKRALLLLSGSAPPNQVALQKRLKAKTGIDLTIRCGRKGKSFDLKKEKMLD